MMWLTTTMLVVLVAASTLLPLWLRRRLASAPNTALETLNLIGPALWMLLAAIMLTLYVADALFDHYDRFTLWRHAFPPAAVLAFIVVVCPARLRQWLVPSLIIPLALLAVADVLNFRVFASTLPIESFLAAGLTLQIRASIWELLAATEWAVVPLLLSAALFAWLWPLARPRVDRPSTNSRLAALVFTCVMGGMGMSLAADTARWLTSRRAWAVFTRAYGVSQSGFLRAHVRDVARAVREHLITRDPTEEKVQELMAYLAKNHAGRGRDAEFGRTRGMSLVQIHVEALQQWTIGAKVLGREVTPFLNRLRRESRYFSNLFDQTGSSLSANCEYAVLNSQHPLFKGAVAFRRPENDFYTLAHILREAGYHTVSFASAERGFWNRLVLHKNYGFERSFFMHDYLPARTISLGVADWEFLHRTADHLRAYVSQTGGPFMAYAITCSSHHPYQLPPDLVRIDVGPLRGTILGSYIESVHYTDRALGMFISRLERMGLMENTLLVVYGDHDAVFNLEPEVSALAREHTNLSAAQVEWISNRDWRTDRIPLFIRFPDAREPSTVEMVGGQINIAPTILHLMGITPPSSFLGHRLQATKSGFVARMNGAFASNDLVYLERNDRTDTFTDRAFQSVGGCYRFPGNEVLPDSACEPFKETVDEQLRLSWFYTLANLRQRVAPDKAGLPSVERGERAATPAPPADELMAGEAARGDDASR